MTTGGWFASTPRLCITKPSPDAPAYFCDREGDRLQRLPRAWRAADPDRLWEEIAEGFPPERMGWKWKQHSSTAPQFQHVEVEDRTTHACEVCGKRCVGERGLKDHVRLKHSTAVPL